MSKFCPLCGEVTNCTDNCNACMEEEARNREQTKRVYPCDDPPFNCPFDAKYSNDCRYYCGIGVDEDEPEEYNDYES